MKAVSNIQNIVPFNQATFYSTEGESMYRTDFEKFVDSFIRSNAKHKDGHYTLEIAELSDLDLEDFAAEIIKLDSNEDDGWYWLTDDKYRKEIANQLANCLLAYGSKKKELTEDLLSTFMKTAINCFRHRMQGYVNERIDQVWHEDMREMGLVLRTHSDNGEIYYTR